ncbi:hypothetical protein ETAA8_14910 [Anatilimnocola aggregata]|uniref:Uncharacterized protein n=1 Tax=Anatilimnocola aggregata TaxID=2528021 RepID=A0A517Y863_9BACT|nr:hypothetical protein [Anatilimnocola aggregata]QDU26413.1 hypothetical protein ETAA8_14910 [Anatilimnocola aggregata]
MRWKFLGSLLALALLAGCGGSESPATSDGGDGGEEADTGAVAAIKSYSAADLPEVDAPLPPQDQGRVVFALPTGWKTLSRNPKFLAAFVPEDGSATKLPRITVAAIDPPVADTSTTTLDNVAHLAEALSAPALLEGKKLEESPKPVELGGLAWVRHVRRASHNDSPAAIQSLQTVRSGRLYTVELTVTATTNPSKHDRLIYSKSLQAHRDYAYAVAANMKFPKDDAGSVVPAAEGEANPTPAEEKKAE